MSHATLFGCRTKYDGNFVRDHQVDRRAVALAEIEQAPRGRVGEDLVFRIPLEGHRHEVGRVPALAQPVHELAHVDLGAAADKRHLRFTDEDGPDCHARRSPYHVANRTLMMSPSSTMYSLPSSRTSP